MSETMELPRFVRVGMVLRDVRSIERGAPGPQRRLRRARARRRESDARGFPEGSLGPEAARLEPCVPGPPLPFSIITLAMLRLGILIVSLPAMGV